MIHKLAIAFLLFGVVRASGAPLSAEDLDRRRKALRDLLDEQWEYTLRVNPEYASTLGDRRYHDQVADASEASVLADLTQTKRFLRRFEAIDASGFSEQERLNRDLMIRDLRERVEWAKFRWWQMPVNQMIGIHLYIAELPASLPFQTVKDYDDYVARLGKFPKELDDTIVNMRHGMAAKLMPPAFLLGKVADQALEIANAPAEQSPFALPLGKFPEGIADAGKARIRAAVLAAIEHSMAPAYRRFGMFVKEEYAPRGQTNPGIWALPDGNARYAFHVRQQTTTSLTPDQIHRIGLDEVTRIEGEMLEIAKKLGYADVKSLNAAIEANPDLKYKTGPQLLDAFSRDIERMYARLPRLFERLPKAKLEVDAVPPFKETGASAAQYEVGAPDGSRPGRVHVNTWRVTSRSTISTEATAYHEGVPGHHLQLSIQQELGDLPKFRQQGGYSAFIEGWGLYAERLGKEVGFYEDPYADYGRLNNEMLRAIRLVADTGYHAKRWTREQVVQFFHDHSAIDEPRVQSEADRYMVVPAQALAYKIGELKILELRDRAQKALGPKFDVRAFHDEVLGAGALPLDVLDERITRWIGRAGAP